MVENRPWLNVFAHAVLIAGVVVVAFPLYITFVASTRTLEEILSVPMPLTPGEHFWENYAQVLTAGSERGAAAPVGRMMLNSLIMALVIAIGKIAISIIASFAIVYFRFPLRKFFSKRLPEWTGIRDAIYDGEYVHHSGRVECLQMRGEYLYAAEGKKGMQAFDISTIGTKGFSERFVTAPWSPLGQNVRIKSKNATCVAVRRVIFGGVLFEDDNLQLTGG